MKDLRGKTAFITGGASGIGYSMAEAFGAEGMNVMLADIERDALYAALEKLRARQIRAEGLIADVRSRDAMTNAAEETIAKFGKVHLVCNNAGVAVGGAPGRVPAKDWDWVLDVNLKGVVHGFDAFLPILLKQEEGGHFVNTASMAGMLGSPWLEPYCASKFAVVAMSEGWATQLAAKNIGISILCPGFVKTRIHEARRVLPQEDQAVRFDGAAMLSEQVLAGIPPEAVAARVVEAVKDNELYIFTHMESRANVEARFKRILEAFDKSSVSPALASLPPRDSLIQPRKA